jgi:hypothetical protein
MNAKLKLLAVCAFSVCLPISNGFLFAAGGNISGQVVDGTTGQPVPNQSVQLLMPRTGMQQVATAMTDAGGHFAIAKSDLATESFYLLQATFQGVNYHSPVKFDDRGRAEADITVYESTPTAPPVRVQSARIIIRAEGSKVHVQEMFAIRNSSQPPRSYVNADGTFLFRLPKTASDPNAAVAGLMNMPLPQPVNPGKTPGDYSIQYPLKPGLTVMMVAYEGDYGSSRLDFMDSVSYPMDNVELLVLPSNLSVNSAVFKPAGTDAESGSARYVAENLAPNTQLAASLSGEGTAPDAAASPTESEVKTLPNSMTRLGVPLLACFLLVLLWGLGVRIAKELPKWKAQQSASELHKALEAEVDSLFNSLADLDDLFANGKIAEKPYWKERLELKARLVAALKKAPPALLESYVIRHTPH